MFHKLFSNRAARQKWDAELVWFRLRYLNAETTTRCLNLLSRPQACGRVALYYQPETAVSALFLGIPETYVRLLQRMMTDFSFSLKSKPSEIEIPAARRMTAVATLPWEKPFVSPWMAHIVNESVFMNSENNKHGSYLPQPPSAKPIPGSTAWHLPDNPPVGLTTQPSWNGQQPPTHLVATQPSPSRWLLGRSRTGIPLHVAGQINIYGRQEAVANWLLHQVTQMIAVDHRNLVVIDGAGDLVPLLKRKTAVTRLFGEQLAYVDIDGASLAGGFNPLAGAPGETEEAMILRWQQWFQGMNVPRQSLELLAQARQAGVGDIPSLQKWLKRMVRTGQYTAVSSLNNVLNRLMANRALREWLEWPTNRFDVLPEGALFFACKGTEWAKQQLLYAVLSGTAAVENARFIVHGFPWKLFSKNEAFVRRHMIISNGPLVANATSILVQCDAQRAHLLGKQFLQGDSCLMENLQLLDQGEALVVTGGVQLFITWLSTGCQRGN